MRPDPFPTTDAELFAFIRERANARPAVKWEVIAEELGIHVHDLLDWFLAYREPKRDSHHRMASRGPAPMLLTKAPVGGHFTQSKDAQRFANWRKAAAGAAATRRG